MTFVAYAFLLSGVALFVFMVINHEEGESAFVWVSILWLINLCLGTILALNQLGIL